MSNPLLWLAGLAAGGLFLYEKNGSATPAQSAAKNASSNAAVSQGGSVNAQLPTVVLPTAQNPMGPAAQASAAQNGSVLGSALSGLLGSLTGEDGNDFSATTNAAAAALVTHLDQSGCTKSKDGLVLAFQTAFQNDPLGHALANGGADGFYGISTRAALSAVIGDDAPASCFSN